MATLSGKRITVFGGSGFLGRHVVEVLAQKGARIRAAVRAPEQATRITVYGDPGQIQPVSADLRDALSVLAACRGADYVVNLVGTLAPSRNASFNDLHADGARTVALAADHEDVAHLVHVSALGVDAPSGAAYARSKLQGESFIKKEMPQATILRPSVIFGPGDGFFDRFGPMLRDFGALPLIRGGKTRFQPVSVADVAAAVAACLEQDSTRGHVYELGGPQAETFRYWLERLAHVAERKALFLPLPLPFAWLLAFFTGWLPGAPLTLDQLRLLGVDNVVGGKARTFRDLGIDPMSVDAYLPRIADAYRKGGRFSQPGGPGA